MTGFDGRAYCRTLSGRPGVYRMFDGDGRLLYVGKARNLRKRVSSYFTGPERLSPKIRFMVSKVVAIEVAVTHTEAEALLLESTLIKELKPRYNVTLRDDKSFPWIHLDREGDFPRLRFHRGLRRGRGRYFGPYPGAGAVRTTINLLQKLFRLRNCEDSVFRNRSRPCLQYQIGRCTAPCVGLIDAAAYGQDVEHAAMFLDGRGGEVLAVLMERMERAAANLDFELAATCRDRIAALQRVLQRQHVDGDGGGDCDVVAVAADERGGCVQLFVIRGGRNLGNRAFFPRNAEGADAEEILTAFLTQYYLATEGQAGLPETIIVDRDLADAAAIATTLGQATGRRIAIRREVRGVRARWLAMAIDNARLALAQRDMAGASDEHLLGTLADRLGCGPIGRVECFDISHTMGEGTVGACVVFGAEGPVKSDYRRYNVEGVIGGDDYAAMRQVLGRRYARVQRENGRLPEVILIDGGQGKGAQAVAVMQGLGFAGITLVGVAKGPGRKPGAELLHVAGRDSPLRLPADSPVLHLIQRIRDEAHRLAITGHRQRRSRARSRSALEDIDGIGAVRRRALIRHFGGLKGVTGAGIDDLCRVPGISRELAHRIYEHFHRT